MITPPRPFGKLTVEAPLEIVPSAHGYHIRDSRKREIWAKITGACGSGSVGSGSASGFDSCPNCAYTWIEVTDTGSTCNTNDLDVEGDIDSWPAYEINGRADIEIGTIVRLIPSRSGPWYVFTPGGSGGSGFQFLTVNDDGVESDDQVYYDASIDVWDDDAQQWNTDPESNTKVWLISRERECLADGDVVVAKIIGSYTRQESSSSGIGSGAEDSRVLYACQKTSCMEYITITGGAIEGGYYPGLVDVWDKVEKAWREGRECYVIDRLQHNNALAPGDTVLAKFIDSIDVDREGLGGTGSGSESGIPGSSEELPTPIYATMVCGVDLSKILKCVENQLLQRGKCLVNRGGCLKVLDDDGNEVSDVSCPE